MYLTASDTIISFSSFLPARAIGVVGDAASLEAFVYYVAMTVIIGGDKAIVIAKSFGLVNFVAYAPRQRQGKQGEEGNVVDC